MRCCDKKWGFGDFWCRWCFYGLVDFDQEEAFLFSWSSLLMTILGTSTLFDFSIASFYDRLFRISLNHFKRSRFRRTFIFSGTPFKFLPIPFYNFRSRTFLLINLFNQTPHLQKTKIVVTLTKTKITFYQSSDNHFHSHPHLYLFYNPS